MTYEYYLLVNNLKSLTTNVDFFQNKIMFFYNKYLVKTENNSYKPDRAKSTNLDKKGLGRLLHAFVVVVLI